MGSYVFAFSNWDSPISSTTSDLVALGILPKQISEYTDEDIGSTILIDYTDESGNISDPIAFEVVGVNHHKDINDETKPTITLMATNTIRCAAFDAKEPNNPDSERTDYGNNRWSVSNIRQWLNSEGAANEWFTPQHEYDIAPDTMNVVNNDDGAYADEAGFLAGFSDEVKQHFATVRNKTILCNVDKLTLSKDFEETEDKVFLPSYTEMGFGIIDFNNPEGNHLDQRFTNDESRLRTSLNVWYLMRTPCIDTSSDVWCVDSTGDKDHALSYGAEMDVVPLIVLY
jgi:hypothetical protein